MKKSSEFIKCENLLLQNGFEATNADDYISYSNNMIGVDMDESEIVFLGDSGDFLHLGLNYLTLVGALIEFRQLSFGYVSTRVTPKPQEGATGEKKKKKLKNLTDAEKKKFCKDCFECKCKWRSPCAIEDPELAEVEVEIGE